MIISRNIISKLLLLLTSLLFILVISELFIRFYWGGPLNIKHQKWEKFDVDLDTICGYKCKAGKNKFLVSEDTVEINCTDCGRKTSENLNCNVDSNSINFYGCSFTFGHGLIDSLTFAWMLQQKLPEYTIHNFGFEGYGISQVYAQILGHINQPNKPKLLIVNYAAFQDMRNMILTTPRRNAYFYQKDKIMLRKIKFPVIYLKNGKIVLDYMNYDYTQRIPFTDKFAILNLLDVAIVNLNDKKMGPERITLEAFTDLNNKCQQNKCTLIINGIVKDPKTNETLERLKERGVLTSQISVDLNNRILLLKDKFHPGKEANEMLAEGFLRLLKEQLKKM